MLQVRLLGQFDVQYNSEPIQIPSRPAQSLLAYLLLNAGKAQRRERLAGLFWPDSSESKARASLRQALWLLRKAIGSDYVLTDKISVTFNAGAPYWLDVAILETSSFESPSADDLIALLSVYAGELLPGFYDEWVVWERERLCAVFEDRMQALLDRLTEEGRWQALHEWAERWIAGGQVPEPAYRALMLAHAELGDQAGMAAVYQRCVQALEEELGVEPSDETLQLYRQLSAGEKPRHATTIAPPLQRRTNLPTPPTPFVGREPELEALSARLDDAHCRLLTLVGPGGSGKTRLALEAARAQADAGAYEHGVFFVPLAPLETVEEVVPTVAGALGFSFYQASGESGTTDPRDQLLGFLRERQLLLVMDNYEHLLSPSSGAVRSTKRSGLLASRSAGDGRERGSAGRPAKRSGDGTDLVTDILASAPDIKILATSRANLNVQEEQLFHVSGMRYPKDEPLQVRTQDIPPSKKTLPTATFARDSDEYSAVKLFVERAQRHLEGFGLTADNAPDVARICRLLDGMPLGVVLAAGWMDVLSPAEIADEIEGGLDFLETDLRNVPQRQRSVRAVFDHSWNMLSPREREVMAALSVFRGGFTRRAAAAVAGATLRELKGLAGKSLLHMAAASSGTTSTSGRYEVHELLRQYAAEKLAQSPTALEATRDRHCAYFAGFLGRRAEALKGPGQLTAVAEIEADAENGLAAWNRATESDQVERLEQAMEGLCLFYQWRGRYEQGDRACETAEGHLAGLGEHQLAPPWNAAPMRARLLAWRGLFNFHLGRHETAQQLLGKSLSLIDEAELAGHDLRRERAFVLRGSGNATLYLGHYTRAGDLFQQSLALCREMDDRWATAHALIGASWAAWNLASYREMEELLRESLALRRALGDKRGIAESLYGLSLPLTWQGKNDESNRLAQESVAISRETGDWANLGWGLEIIALGLEFGGKLTEAQSVLEERKMICEELGDQAALASAIFLLGDLQLHLGQYEDASVQLQSSLRLARETGYTRAMACSLLGLGRVRLAEGAYTEAKPWIQEGLGLIQVSGPQTELDWALVYLALTELGLGNRRQARKFCHQAFETAIKQITSLHLPDAVALMALLLADENEGERAETLFALACRYPRVGKSQWWEDVAGKRIAAVATTLPPDVVAAAQERGRARDLDATVRELLEELEA